MNRTARFHRVGETSGVVVSHGTMEFNRTGSWRYLRPISTEKAAPCRRHCPAGTDIPHVLSLVNQGRLEEAYRLIRTTNPFPAICGRVCYHPCEADCTRAVIDEGIAVHSVERFVGDEGLQFTEAHPPERRTSRRAAVVGSGPAGLTCAYYLSRNGVPVTLFEADPEPGGMLRSGIPAYRLPRTILDREIAKVEAAGVQIVTGCRIGEDRSFASLLDEFDSVFVAAGAHRSRGLPCPTPLKGSALSGLDFLQAVNAGHPPPIGREVIVVGGGNTAMDAARSAVRLGARVTVVYRRTRDEMPAHPSEVEEAVREGVEFIFLASPVSVRMSGSRAAVELLRMELGSPDSSGRPRPVEIPGSNYILEADSLLTAVGEEPDLSFCRSASNVFVGGDASTGPSTVIDAIAAGRRGAGKILDYLGLERLDLVVPGLPPDPFEVSRLNRDYFSTMGQVSPSPLPVEGRLGGFAEIVPSLPRSAALLECHRCLSCGVCNECNNCWLFCPEGAIRPGDGHYEIDLQYCKGCGICVEECPRGVIDLVEEES